MASAGGRRGFPPGVASVREEQERIRSLREINRIPLNMILRQQELLATEKRRKAINAERRQRFSETQINRKNYPPVPDGAENRRPPQRRPPLFFQLMGTASGHCRLLDVQRREIIIRSPGRRRSLVSLAGIRARFPQM